MWDSMERTGGSTKLCLTWQAGSGASTNMHMGMSYVRYRRRVLQDVHYVDMRYERWEWKKERGKLVTGIVYHREYRVVYLNTLACSAYSQVGQSAKSPKLHLHHTSCTHAFPVVWCSQQLQRVPEHLNSLSSWNRGHTLLVSGAH